MLDTVGGGGRLRECRRVLQPKGVYVHVGGRMVRVLAVPIISPFVSQKLLQLIAKRNAADLEILSGLIEAGKMTPVIDRTYPLSEIPEAIRYLEGGHARGKIVITV
jgi:NADPH:quinone reductase-like Zn-dependent oxidoreductase